MEQRYLSKTVQRVYLSSKTALFTRSVSCWGNIRLGVRPILYPAIRSLDRDQRQAKNALSPCDNTRQECTDGVQPIAEKPLFTPKLTGRLRPPQPTDFSR